MSELFCVESKRRRDERPVWSRPGESAAFEGLFQHHRGGLLRFLARRLGSREDAEDALMQTFVNAWRARETFRGEAGEQRWLYSIAARVAIDLLRTRRRRPAQPLDQVSPDCLPFLPDPADAAMEASRWQDVAAAVQRLKPDSRRLVQLFYYEGWGYAEIGSAFGIPMTRVKGRLHRIRRRLEEDLRTPGGSAASAAC